MAVSSIALQLAALTALKAVGNPLNAPTLITYSNPVAITKAMLVGQFTESDYDGYAAMAALAFGTPYLPPSGNAIMETPSVEFVCTGLTLVESVYGWAVVNAAKDAVYIAEALPASVQMNAIGRGLIVIPRYQYGQ